MHAASCTKPGLVQLMWLRKVGEPPGDPNHNIGYDHDVIEMCPECNGATLEKLKHDCFDFEEVWDQYEWYDMDPSDGLKLRALAARCERPLDPFCNCATHASLRKSADALPASSWNAVYESDAHRHRITVSDDERPGFTLLARQVTFTPLPHTDVVVNVKADRRALLFLTVGWPVTYAVALGAWFRMLDVPWLADALYVVGMLPVTFFAAGLIMALPALFKPVSPKAGDDRVGDEPRAE